MGNGVPEDICRRTGLGRVRRGLGVTGGKGLGEGEAGEDRGAGVGMIWGRWKERTWGSC